MTQHLTPEVSPASIPTDDEVAGNLAAEELVEEVSIDGMCGVY